MPGPWDNLEPWTQDQHRQKGLVTARTFGGGGVSIRPSVPLSIPGQGTTLARPVAAWTPVGEQRLARY